MVDKDTCVQSLESLSISINAEIIGLTTKNQTENVNFLSHIIEKIKEIVICKTLAVFTSSEHGMYTNCMQLLCSLLQILTDFALKYKTDTNTDFIYHVIETLNRISTKLYCDNRLC